MKKILSLFIFSLVVLSASAQIQTEFFGIKLAKSTKQEFTNILNQKGIKFIEEVDETDADNISIIVENLQYEGHTWPVVIFKFNLKFYHIAFVDNLDSKNQKSLEASWKQICKSILNKYPSYYKSEESDSEVLLFKDKDTTLFVAYGEVDGYKTLQLHYWDSYLKAFLDTLDELED